MYAGGAQEVLLDHCHPSVLLTLMDQAHCEHLNYVVHKITMSDTAKTLNWLESHAPSTIAELCGWLKKDVVIDTTVAAQPDSEALVTALIAVIRYFLGLEEQQSPPHSILKDNGSLKTRIYALMRYQPFSYSPQDPSGFTKIGQPNVGTAADKSAYIQHIENWKKETATRKKKEWFEEAQREKWIPSTVEVNTIKVKVADLEALKKVDAEKVAKLEAQNEQDAEMRDWYKRMKMEGLLPTTAPTPTPTTAATTTTSSSPAPTPLSRVAMSKQWNRL